MCGGTGITECQQITVIGLSPRVRGNLPGVGYAISDERSIPACAGEPRVWRYHFPTVRVYPRVCGGT